MAPAGLDLALTIDWQRVDLAGPCPLCGRQRPVEPWKRTLTLAGVVVRVDVVCAPCRGALAVGERGSWTCQLTPQP